MSSRVVLRADAEADIESISDYIAADSLDSARRFRSVIRTECQALAEMPGMGARRDFDNPRLANVRSWPVKGFRNYLIFYRGIEGGIEVLRILHGARNIERLFRGGGV